MTKATESFLLLLARYLHTTYSVQRHKAGQWFCLYNHVTQEKQDQVEADDSCFSIPAWATTPRPRQEQINHNEHEYDMNRA